MKLFFTYHSPYARLVRVFIREKGLREEVEEVSVKLRSPENETLRHGPGGKVPALLTEEGRLLTESLLILAYLDAHGPGDPLVTSDPALLEIEGVAIVLTDSVSLRFREGLRPADERSPGFLTYETDRCLRGYDTLEGIVDRLGGSAGRITTAHMSVAISLVAADRFVPEDGWRDRRPGLASWYESFARRPSMSATRPPPD